MSEPKSTEAACPASARPSGSAILPERDGYYWMRNVTEDEPGEPKIHWRIVRVFDQVADYGPRPRRVARDGNGVYDAKYLSDWKGLQFHGPIYPPNDKSSDGAKKQ